MGEGPKIASLPQSEWTPEVEAIFPILEQPGSPFKGSDFNSLLMMAHHPEIAVPFLRFNLAAVKGFVLSARTRELAILRLSWHRRCQYEWVHHLYGGAGAGLTNDHFAALARSGIGAIFTPEERAVILATDDVCTEGKLSDHAWAALREHYSDKQIIELIMLIGCFLNVATLLNSVGVELEPPFLAGAVAKGWPVSFEADA